METITLEEALALFQLPRQIGDFEEAILEVNIGRYGPYVKHQSKFYSLEKTDDPYTITAPRAVELIKAKRKAEAEKFIKVFEEGDEKIQVLNGRFGPYIKAGGKNVKIPSAYDPHQLTLEDCRRIIEEAPAAKKKGKKK